MNASPGDLMRLDAIVKHLGISNKWNETLRTDVADVCIKRVKTLIAGVRPRGEDIAHCLATHFQVRFEEVRQSADIDKLINYYLKQLGELGFGRLRDELDDRTVDALLFQRINATAKCPDRWVAVLNLLYCVDRGYWDRYHELTHRIIEPPQHLLPFKRERSTVKNVVEVLVDDVAGELGFYPSMFRPVVLSLAAKSPELTFARIGEIRQRFAPTSSLLAVTNAVVKHWPRPAAAFTAKFGGRLGQPDKDRDLRVAPQAHNQMAVEAGIIPFKNMRVPQSSSIYACYLEDQDRSGEEDLGLWITSRGSSLPEIRGFSSARSSRACIYGILSLS